MKRFLKRAGLGLVAVLSAVGLVLPREWRE